MYGLQEEPGFHESSGPEHQLATAGSGFDGRHGAFCAKIDHQVLRNLSEYF